MGIISKVKQKLLRAHKVPLIYDEELKRAYSSTSVCGGKMRGKTVAVTGATGGIGVAIALRFLSEGSNVIVIGRNEEKLQAIVAEVPHKEGTLSYKVLDSKEPSTFSEIVGEIFAGCTIDLWVNCAGILKKTDRDRKFRGLPCETYFEVMDTNLKSTMLLNTLVADKMIQTEGKGKIINISSICGITNHYGYTPYGISKTGLIEYTRLYAERYEGKIIFLCVSPGSVATRMGTHHFGGDVSGSNSLTAHIAIPEEIAAVVCFLSGEVGDYMNGQNVLASASEKV